MSGVSFLLIPGAGGSAWYWHLVASKLEERGHEAVAVTLPTADDTAALPEYVAAVIRASGNREPRHIVLVAQSLGGFTAPLGCQQIPVAMLVLINAMIPKPGERAGEWWANTRYEEARGQQNRRQGRPVDAPFDPLIEFFHDVPQPVIDAACDRGEPSQSESVFASPCTFERWPTVPTRVLIARDDRFFPADFQRRVARDRLGISALSRPDELSARLIAYATKRGMASEIRDRGAQ